MASDTVGGMGAKRNGGHTNLPERTASPQEPMFLLCGAWGQSGHICTFFKRNWKCISFCEICGFFLNVGLSFLRAIMLGKEVTSVGHIETMSTGLKP